jgi:hypothetical protein
MESVNPNKIAFIETLDYHISEMPIHSSEGGPKFSLPTTISVNRALSYVIHSVFGILRVVRLNLLTSISVPRIHSRWARVNRGDVVKNRPKNTFTEAIVPADFTDGKARRISSTIGN